MSDETDVKAIAMHELDAAKSSRQALLEEHSASFKWLMASMLALNSGGLFALSDMADIEGAHRAASAIMFVIGILCALAIAWLGQISARKMLEPLSEMTSFWIVAAASGQFNEDEHSRIGSEIQSVIDKSKKARYCGWVSVVAFVLGVGSIGTGIEAAYSPASDAAVEALPDTVEMPVNVPLLPPTDD